MAITIENSGAGLVGRNPHSDTKTRIKITSGTIVGGKHASVGEIMDVEAREARTLFANGKAVPYADSPPKPMVREPKPSTRDGEADPAGPACAKCGQDLTDRRRKRVVDTSGGILCATCAKG
jgi:hypothetical protein